jgi:signal transduction histidine kinase
VNTVAIRLIARLLAIQIGMCLLTEAIVATFAPKLLLLDSDVLRASVMPSLYTGGAIVLYEVIATLAVTRSLRPCLRALGVGSSAVDPRDLLALYALPAKLTILDVLGAFFFVSVSLFRPLRPLANDITVQVEIVALATTMGSVAAVTGYVMLRASVARVLEVAPDDATRDAIAILELSPQVLPRVRMRLLLAVTLPVAFVAVGASLLVVAHLRAFDIGARESDAAELVRAALEPLNGGTAGRSEAIAESAKFGFEIDVAPVPARFRAVHDENGMAQLTVPLDDGHATVRFQRTRLNPTMVVYVLLTIVVSALAAIIGSRLGMGFVSDVALVTREVRNLGVQDVLRGTRVQRGARFTSMSSLMKAIDELGGIFREFASTQEKAIDARAAAERMRGLFLASMSHDLKAPLNAILGFAELASRNALSLPQRESLTIIEQRGRELLHLIQTILDAARVEAGELSISPEPTMVGDVVMSAVVEARELATEGDVNIVGEIQPGVPRIFVDPTRIIQALTLVVLTGSRFAEQGLVRVRATVPVPGDRLRIDVDVPGRGVPSAELERIFEAFKDPERARRHGSLGLGLSLARSILELHGGSVEASTTPSSGTEFHIWLPASDRISSYLLDGFAPPSSPSAW